jgi:hypothetical protein
MRAFSQFRPGVEEGGTLAALIDCDPGGGRLRSHAHSRNSLLIWHAHLFQEFEGTEG